MTERYLAQAIIGNLIPSYAAADDDTPEPYRTTAMQARALKKVQGSQPVEPSEADTPITEEPT